MSDCKDQAAKKQDRQQMVRDAKARTLMLLRRVIRETGDFYEITNGNIQVSGKTKREHKLSHIRPILEVKEQYETDGLDKYWNGRVRIRVDTRMGLSWDPKLNKSFTETKKDCALTANAKDAFVLIFIQMKERFEKKAERTALLEERRVALLARAEVIERQVDRFGGTAYIVQSCEEDGTPTETLNITMSFNFDTTYDDGDTPGYIAEIHAEEFLVTVLEHLEPWAVPLTDEEIERRYVGTDRRTLNRIRR
jgi:hypothetical protein